MFFILWWVEERIESKLLDIRLKERKIELVFSFITLAREISYTRARREGPLCISFKIKA